jgi:hypothetical protein
MDREPIVNKPPRLRDRVVQAGEPAPWKDAPPPAATVPVPRKVILAARSASSAATPGAADENRPAAGATTDPSPPAVQVGERVCCDHVVFTSIRSLTGEGYRVVAASTAVKPEEKTEITQWSPSHGGLGEAGEDAVGLLAYPLRSGRYAVALVRPAGEEHTGRGGQRVLTHTVLLDKSSYRRFDHNPVRVHGALRRAAAHWPLEAMTGVLDPLALSAGLCATLPPIFAGAADASRFANLVTALLTGRRWIFSGIRRQLAALEWALQAVPWPARTGLSATVAVRFAPSRPAKLVLLGPDDTQARRAVQGQDFQWCDGEPIAAAGYELWLGLVRRWSAEGRFRELSELTGRLADPPQPAILGRLAALCEDFDRRGAADADLRQQIREKYATFAPASDLERELVEQLRAD